MARLRIFAGPNGSGKSTLNENLRGKFNFGYYINADNIKKDLDVNNQFDFANYDLQITNSSFKNFIHTSIQNQTLIQYSDIEKVRIENNIMYSNNIINSYSAALIADFVREQLLIKTESFSFETVFSHPSKIEIIKRAKALGFRTYLYYIATISHEINVSRVEQRELLGGHSVSREKIIKRYYNSLNNLYPALKEVHRAYLFDNSGMSIKLVAEVNPNKDFKILTDHIPEWLIDNVVSKLKNE